MLRSSKVPFLHFFVDSVLIFKSVTLFVRKLIYLRLNDILVDCLQYSQLFFTGEPFSL